MLVERGFEIHDIPELASGLLLRARLNVGYQQTLEYLCRSGAIQLDRNQLSPTRLSRMLDRSWSVAPTMRDLYTMGFRIDWSDRGWAQETVCARLRASITLQEMDEEDQANELSGLVLEFSIWLQNGWDPEWYIPLHDMAVTAWSIVQLDPQFAAVAWKLALKLNGYVVNEDEGGGEDEDSDSDGDWSTEPENEDMKEAKTDSTTDGQDIQMPGSWVEEVEEEFKPPQRHTTSREGDFVPVYGGRCWEPEWYSSNVGEGRTIHCPPLEHPVFRR